jgi:tetratricopeptide (TPR) repeat protein
LNRPPLLLSLLFIAAPVLAAVDPGDFAKARALFDAKKFPEARAAFERLSAADSGNADVHYYLGQLAMDREDADAAVRELEKAASLAPDSARNHSALGEAYGSAAQKAGLLSKYGLARKCLAEFERAAELDPGDVDYHESLFDYYFNAPSVAGGGPTKAADQAAIIEKLDPRRGHLAYASLYVSDGKYDLAFAELEEALKIAPEDYASLYQIGRLAAVSGLRLERGAAALRLCLKLAVPQGSPPHAAAEWRLGNILEKEGDSAGARVAYKAALEIDPKFTQASDALRNLK